VTAFDAPELLNITAALIERARSQRDDDKFHHHLDAALSWIGEVAGHAQLEIVPCAPELAYERGYRAGTLAETLQSALEILAEAITELEADEDDCPLFEDGHSAGTWIIMAALAAGVPIEQDMSGIFPEPAELDADHYVIISA
jgi:hypothetical protein